MRRALPGLAVAAFAMASVLFAGGPARSDELEHRIRVPFVSSDRAEHPVETPLRIAEQQWAAAGIENYSLIVSVARFGVHELHTLTLIDNEITGVQSSCTLGGEPYPCGDIDADRFTVPGLFAQIHERLRNVPIEEDPSGTVAIGAPFIDASFAPGLGLPYSHSWGLRLVADSGETVTIDDFRALDPEEDLASARLRWERSAITDYVMEMMIFEPVETELATSEVRGGEVVSVTAVCEDASGTESCEPSRPNLTTVEGLFAHIESRLDDPDMVVSTVYDVVNGRPSTIVAGTLMTGDILDAFSVLRFEPLP